MLRAPLLLVVCAATLAAQSRPVPPPGVPVPDATRASLSEGLTELRASIERLGANPLLPDVRIYHEAVRYALEYNEFFKADEFDKAAALLRQGQARADALAAGQHPWTTATGLVPRGYVSKIDRSVQPYGLVVPPSYSPTAPHRWRLDIWFHGRGETLSEVNFLTDRGKNPGEFTPPDTIVLHLYGRYCNANRLAGEVDLFEAMADVKRHYAIDENRILVRGFSMGGAAAWHFGVHFAGLWAAIAPGAGFSETTEFLRIKPEEIAATPAWQKSLWHLYDATDWAINLANTPIVAYSGEIDGQKQAADAMERAMAAEGLRMRHVIGPKTPHRYHPDSKVELNGILDPISERGRDEYPYRVRFTTWSMAYNRMKWVVVDALAKHWERARIDAAVTGDSALAVITANLTAFSFDFGPGGCQLNRTVRPTVTIDGQKVTAPALMSDGSWTAHFRKTGNTWSGVETADRPGLHKRHGLQGPVDDAFLDSFTFVRPTGTPRSPEVAKWAEAEQAHAVAAWRKQFRGEAQVRDDRQITDADIASSNLVLWGDPGSNQILARIADRLPVKWEGDSLVLGGQRYPAATHAPILIFPNPLNPKKYVVLNSGFTFREFDYLNNARQYPHLPDYAIIDTTTPPNDRFPGKIVTAGFFNEDWEL
jgi:dienelactone hydrolase